MTSHSLIASVLAITAVGVLMFSDDTAAFTLTTPKISIAKSGPRIGVSLKQYSPMPSSTIHATCSSKDGNKTCDCKGSCERSDNDCRCL